MGKFSVQGVVALVAGLAALVGPELWAHHYGEQPLMVLGALLALAGLFAVAGAPGPSDWTTTAFAVLLFVSPWAFGFTHQAAADWTAWIAGGVAAIVGLWAAYGARSSS